MILGAIFAALGLGMTVYSWYTASKQGHIETALAFIGAAFLVSGSTRIITAASPARMLRFVAIALGLAAGYGHVALQKAVFPNDSVIASTQPNN